MSEEHEVEIPQESPADIFRVFILQIIIGLTSAALALFVL